MDRFSSLLGATAPPAFAAEPGRKLVFAIAGLHALFPLLWLLGVWRNGPTPTDWLHLKIVADHFVAGDWAHLYAVDDGAINPGYFWRYPPFALYLVAPLAGLSRGWAYFAVVATQLVALAASMALLLRLAPARGCTPEWVVVVVFSAPVLTTLVVGQNSGLMVLTVVVAASLWARQRVFAAGALLGLFALKPNWGAAVFLCLMASRQWRIAAAMASASALLVLLSLPLGTGLWSDFVAASLANGKILVAYEGHKLITLKGFIDGTVGVGAPAQGLWALAVVVLTTAAITIWRRPATPLHHLGTALLFAVAANPYASFYDALVLIVPASVWWAERALWRPSRWQLVGALVALAWLGEHAHFTWLPLLAKFGLEWTPAVSIVGPLVSLWLLLEAAEALRRHPSSPLRRRSA